MEYDHMIEALTPNGSNHPLHMGPLPRGFHKNEGAPELVT